MWNPNQDNDDTQSIDTLMSPCDVVNTPNSSECEKPTEEEYIPAVPCSGKKYKIHLRDTDKLITVKEGEVVLQSPAESHPGGGSYWVCVEKDNWLGFRNHVSGNFLGHNGKHGFHAKAAHHKKHEFFCVRRNPLGGYTLLVYYSWGQELLQVGYSPDEKTLVGKETDGAQWMFEEV